MLGRIVIYLRVLLLSPSEWGLGPGILPPGLLGWEQSLLFQCGGLPYGWGWSWDEERMKEIFAEVHWVPLYGLVLEYWLGWLSQHLWAWSSTVYGLFISEFHILICTWVLRKVWLAHRVQILLQLWCLFGGALECGRGFTGGRVDLSGSGLVIGVGTDWWITVL